MAKKRVTSWDVAKRAGVSRTTVSFVLNNTPNIQITEETRQRVLAAARELNYYPNAAARSLATRRAGAIGLVLFQTPARLLADPFLPGVLRGLAEVAQAQDFRVLLHSEEDVHQPDNYLQLAREKRIDGLVISGPRSDDPQLEYLLKDGFPLVLQGQIEGKDVHFVDVDNVSGARQAVMHLIGLGHRRIGMITNAPLQYTASQARLRGYGEALERHDLPFEETLVRYGDFTEESGRQAARELMEGPELPTALFVASDLVAFGAMAAIQERGLKIPGDIAVVGFDDLSASTYIDPPLTTIRLPAYDLGRRAGEMIIQLINGQELAEKQVFLETELVIRKSCGFHFRSRGIAS
ncbi:MAG: LacI family DNA-binding transcriptional regulator [Anaerolineae bacterium]